MLNASAMSPTFDGVGRWVESSGEVLDGLWLSQASITSFGDADDSRSTVFSVDGAIVAPRPTTSFPEEAPCLLVAIAWLAFGVQPGRSGDTSERLGVAEVDAEYLIEELAASRAQPDTIDEIQRRIADDRTAVPDQLGIGSFVSSVDAVATDNSIALEGLAPSVSDTSASLPVGTSSVTLTVAARGGYENLLAFIDDLAALERLVIVDLVQLNADVESDDILLDASIRIFTTADLTQDSSSDTAALDDADGHAP